VKRSTFIHVIALLIGAEATAPGHGFASILYPCLRISQPDQIDEKRLTKLFDLIKYFENGPTCDILS
jgi:hypothetical protein